MSRDARSRVAELENQALVARIMARKLFRALSARVEVALDVLLEAGLDTDVRRVLDDAFDAAETVWDRHRISIVPVRRILDQDTPSSWTWPVQAEAYLAKYPGGETKNITREQLMMMAGMDPES